MTDLRKAAEMALDALDEINKLSVGEKAICLPAEIDDAMEALRQALAQPVDAVFGFTVTEPRQNLSRMKPGDRFVLVRTGEIYHIKKDGSQWNDTRQRPARLHKNSQVRLIVDAVNISQERVDETAKREHDTLGSEWAECVKLPIVVHVRKQRDGETHISTREGITPVLPDDLIMRGVAGEEYPIGRELFERTYTFDTAPPKREWVGLTDEERHSIREWQEIQKELGPVWAPMMLYLYLAIEAKLKEKNHG